MALFFFPLSFRLILLSQVSPFLLVPTTSPGEPRTDLILGDEIP